MSPCCLPLTLHVRSHPLHCYKELHPQIPVSPENLKETRGRLKGLPIVSLEIAISKMLQLKGEGELIEDREMKEENKVKEELEMKKDQASRFEQKESIFLSSINITSQMRKLANPFVFNRVTAKAAEATLKAAKKRRGAWPDFSGLCGGAPESKTVRRETPVMSKEWISGRFEGQEAGIKSELFISHHKGEITIVRKSEAYEKVSRFRIELDVKTTDSRGETVEMGDFSPQQDVFKKIWMRGGKENSMEIEEYVIRNPSLAPTHSSKLVGVTHFSFLNDNGVEKVKVMFLLVN